LNVLFSLLDADVAGGQVVALHVAAGLASDGGGVGLLVPAPGPMVERFAALGARTHVHPLSSLRQPWTVPGVARVLRGYDLLYSHTSVPGEILGDMASRMARRPHVIHEHAPQGPHFSPRPAIRAAQRSLYRRMGGSFIAVAPHVRDALERCGVRPSRIVVVPNGAPDPSTVPPRNPPTGPPTIGMIGRLDPQKGIEDFVDATARLDRAGLRLRVSVREGSQGSYGREVRERLVRSGVQIVERSDGLSFMTDLDIAVVPSRYEGSPLVLLEAMAMGLPIVASDIPGIREFIDHGRTGLLVPPGDPASMAAAIQGLLDDEPLRRRLGAAARQAAMDRFPMERTVARCLDVLYRANARTARTAGEGDLRARGSR
jgi:glycosyltransferase involved in cell wall biosynthesis